MNSPLFEFQGGPQTNMSGVGMCTRCGGGTMKQTAPSPILRHAELYKFCEGVSQHWLFVYGYLMNRVLLSQISNVPYETWIKMRELLYDMGKCHDENVLPLYLQKCTGMSPAKVIRRREWSRIPLILDRDFFGLQPKLPFVDPEDEEDRLFFFCGKNILGHPLTSESGNVSMTRGQYLHNMTHVLWYIDNARSNVPCYMLSPLILWSILHGDIRVAATQLLCWLPRRAVMPELSARALKRENWIFLLGWLGKLDYENVDMAWVILRKFMVRIADAASYTTGVSKGASNILSGTYGHELPKDDQEELFRIEDADAWWGEVLSRDPHTDTVRTLESMYFFDVFASVKARVLLGKGGSLLCYSRTNLERKTIMKMHGVKGSPSFAPDPWNATTEHVIFYNALCRAEILYSVSKQFKVCQLKKRYPPDWILRRDVPKYEMRPGLYFDSVLATCDPTEDPEMMPHTRVVPLSSTYCMCFGPNGDSGCEKAPFDPRVDIAMVTLYSERIASHDSNFTNKTA